MKLSIPDSLKKFFRRYNLTMFIVFLAGSLAFVVFSLIPIINSSYATTDSAANPTESATPTLNQDTIKRVEQLQPSGTPSELPHYSGRINPFAE